jgi:hypothetical protein
LFSIVILPPVNVKLYVISELPIPVVSPVDSEASYAIAKSVNFCLMKLVVELIPSLISPLVLA